MLKLGRILFCNIAWMDYYKGNEDGNDIPKGGGSYVVANQDANEKYNFTPVSLSDSSGEFNGDYCLGFVETKSTNGKTQNQLNIEKICGCELCKNESNVEDVLVVYCALYPDSMKKETYVVGWYQHATVYRYYEMLQFETNGDGYYVQEYNAIAKKEDCVLLPRQTRRKGNIWRVPRKSRGISYGFGQANVWFAQGAEENEHLRRYLEKLEKQIVDYDGENWVDKYKL